MRSSGFASPADYVYTPIVEYGEKEVDIKYGSARQKDGTYAQAASIGFGYGAKEHWFTEFYLKQERSGNQNNNLAEWENKFQLTETGEYPVDIGLITELEAPLSGNAPWEFKFGPLLQTEFGKLQLNGNLLFERAFGKADESGIPYSTNIQLPMAGEVPLAPCFRIRPARIGGNGKMEQLGRTSRPGSSYRPRDIRQDPRWIPASRQVQRCLVNGIKQRGTQPHLQDANRV